METLKTLPDLEGRKFGAISFGYDKVDRIRMEFSALASLATLFCGCDADSLNIPQIQRLVAAITARKGTLTAEDFAKVDGLSAIDLLALGASTDRT